MKKQQNRTYFFSVNPDRINYVKFAFIRCRNFNLEEFEKSYVELNIVLAPDYETWKTAVHIIDPHRDIFNESTYLKEPL